MYSFKILRKLETFRYFLFYIILFYIFTGIYLFRYLWKWNAYGKNVLCIWQIFLSFFQNFILCFSKILTYNLSEFRSSVLRNSISATFKILSSQSFSIRAVSLLDFYEILFQQSVLLRISEVHLVFSVIPIQIYSITRFY